MPARVTDSGRILVFGGTTEGRAAVKVVSAGAGGYLYSTLGTEQSVETPGGRRLTGAMDAGAAVTLCRAEGVRLIIDAAHPFAEGVHAMVAAVAAGCGLPVIRYERRAVEAAGVTWCDGWDDAVRRLEADGVRRLLALSGVRTIPRLRAFWERHDCRFRVLDRPGSVAEADGYGFPRTGLLFYREGEPEIDVMRREMVRVPSLLPAGEGRTTPPDHSAAATTAQGVAPAVSTTGDVAEAPLAVLTKESGESGGFPAKVAAARELGLPLYVVRRPAMPAGFHTVYTETGLRRRIDELLPGYFALRSGYTTGTVATAAACAALRALLDGRAPESVTIALPGGESATLAVAHVELTHGGAHATVIKDAGDDPDVTHGARVSARVTLDGHGAVQTAGDAAQDGDNAAEKRSGIRFLQGEGIGRVTLGMNGEAGPSEETQGIRFLQGVSVGRVTLGINDEADPSEETRGIRFLQGNGVGRVTLGINGEGYPSEETRGIRFLQGNGVGRVTLPGLGIAVGEPAVNPVPRAMIRENFASLGVTVAEVTISVEGGAELARKTLNARLGVLGGISILGTSGVVMPFSDEAFIQSIEREVAVARAVGSPVVVFSSGAKSERAVRAEFPALPPQAFVHYGNFIGGALRAAAAEGFARVAVGVMIGKAVKLAEGHLDTHSRSTAMNRDFLRSLAAHAGCSPEALQAIEAVTLARELWTALPEADLAPFMRAVLTACHARCAPLLPAARLTLLLVPEEGPVRFKS